ncbi:MAG: PAS domain S-box protein [Kiritimatiellia bacterium]
MAKEHLAKLAEYRKLVEQLPAISYIVDLGQSNRTVYISPQVETILGFTPAEWLADPHLWIRQLVDEDRDRITREIYRKNATGGSFYLVYRVRAKNGQIKWFRNHASYMENENGEPRYVHGVMLDITGYRETEEALRQSQLGYQRIFESIQDVYVETDSSGRVRAVSPSVSDLTGFDPSELHDRPLQTICADPAQVAGLMAALRQDGMLEDAEVSVLHKNGTIEYCSFNARVLKDEPDTPMIGTLHKITERKHVEMELQHARDTLERRVQERTAELMNVNRKLRAEILDKTQTAAALKESQARLVQSQKMEALGQLVCGISHDFNNLLTAIMAYSQLALNGMPGKGPVQQDMEQVISECSRASRLTQKLLSIGRSRILEIEPLDINEIVDEMEPFMKRSLGEHIELNIRKGDIPGCIRADSSMMEQIVLNLAVNARDAMPNGGALTVETALVPREGTPLSAADGRHSDCIRLTVRDTGCGMPDDVRERIFEPFFTTKKKGEGTGLGLAMVADFMRQFGGAVTAQSRPGGGTEFQLYFPRSEGAAVCRAERESAAMPRGNEGVLVLEDDDVVRHLAVRLLNSLGYQALEAETEAEAQFILDQDPSQVNLIFADIIMPKVNGPDIVGRLRKRHPGLKVLYTTGFSTEMAVRTGIRENRLQKILGKPYTRATLAARVRETLDNAEPEL